MFLFQFERSCVHGSLNGAPIIYECHFISVLLPWKYHYFSASPSVATTKHCCIIRNDVFLKTYRFQYQTSNINAAVLFNSLLLGMAIFSISALLPHIQKRIVILFSHLNHTAGMPDVVVLWMKATHRCFKMFTLIRIDK